MEKINTTNNRFTWIPFFTELANKLLEYKDDRSELMSIAYESGNADYIKSKDDEKVNDIDPFTFFGIFNRGLKDENRTKIAEFFKERLSLKSEVPSDFAGIPVVMNQSATFFNDTEIDITVPLLWKLFEAAIKKDHAELANIFDKALKQKGIKWNITMGLYWIRPYDYIGLDSINRAYLTKIRVNVFDAKMLNGENYLKLLDDVKQKMTNQDIKESSIPEISYNAWKAEPQRTYWLVGFSFGGNDSQLNRFIKKKIWEGGFDVNNSSDKKLLELTKSIKQGDVLILKSSSTKGPKHDIPFIRVKAAGVVTSPIETKVLENGSIQCKCDVKYGSVTQKDFDGSIYGAYRMTIHKANDDKMSEVREYADSILIDNRYKKYIDQLKSNYNLVLTGAPGTGKTFMTKEIAKAMGCSNDEIAFVQFHPSYDYTDFVEGLRPTDDGAGHIGFERKDGVFKELCRKALQNTTKPHVFIIDEINRGEASKIFGELFYAIDPGYRGKTEVKVKTQYQNLIPESDAFADGFFVPDNVYIICTMNDIDRSVESMDFAMRRRFTWIEVKPEETQDMLDGLDEELATKAKDSMNRLNKCIRETDGLGTAYQIGAAYFLKLQNYSGDFEALWNMNIELLLREYLRGFRHVDETIGKYKAAFFRQDSNLPNE